MKKILVFAITLIVCSSVFAQKLDSTIINKKFKYIRFQPFQLIYNEITLNVEIPISNRFDISFGGGYVKNTNKRNENTFSGGHGSVSRYTNQNFLNPFLQSYKLDLGVKYYLSQQRNFFINFNLFYRKWWLDNTFLMYDDNLGYNFVATRTERVNVVGGKLLIGNNIDLYAGKNFSFNITPYIGVGFRYKLNYYKSIGIVNDNFYFEANPLIEKSADWYITPQIGFMCGLGIR